VLFNLIGCNANTFNPTCSKSVDKAHLYCHFRVVLVLVDMWMLVITANASICKLFLEVVLLLIVCNAYDVFWQ
jgi:hypothetical protein